MTTARRPVRFSLILPTLNEAARLPVLLDSIRRQRYPSESIELLIADGGSTDETIDIASAFGARIFHNPARRAEPGAGMLLEKATGDVAMWLAADNVFAGDRFLEKMAAPFGDERIVGAFPSLVSTAQDGGTARYFNAFTDPFNHFIYGGGTSPISYHRTYRVKRRTNEYVVYDFGSGPQPLIALAQAFTIRLPYHKPVGTDEYDVAPVEVLLADGHEIAFVQSAALEHHTVRDIGDALRKFGPRFRARLTDRRTADVGQAARFAPAAATTSLFLAVLRRQLYLARGRGGWRVGARPAFGMALSPLRQRCVRFRILETSEHRRGRPREACSLNG